MASERAERLAKKLAGVPDREECKEGVYAYWPRFIPLWDYADVLAAELREVEERERALAEAHDEAIRLLDTCLNDASPWRTEDLVKRMEDVRYLLALARGGAPATEETT